jgi:hypothetical protein
MKSQLAQVVNREVYAPAPRDARLSCIAQARDVLNTYCRKRKYPITVDHIAGESLRRMARVPDVDIRSALYSAQELADKLAQQETENVQ